MAAHMAPQKMKGRLGRDAALGLVGVLLILALGALVVLNALARYAVDQYEQTAYTESVMDGSNAGANAVTLEELKAQIARDEYEVGEWSVTLEDLEREYELGKAYPPNGKNAALYANTTYGKGGGMVDLVTFDKSTNTMIRHYGQLEPDGRVRWYAAETVLDEDGKPRVMPQN